MKGEQSDIGTAATQNGQKIPFRIHAQILRKKISALEGAVPGFLPMSDDDMTDSSCSRASRRRGWRQADLKRAINAAEQAGLKDYRVEIAPDGTITIVVGMRPLPDGDTGCGIE